ncbi:hypothetical protein GCM10009749_31060 [Agromyces neolithicus]|uniref:Uncharacterized protein n=1 Tax=Agromyces neolithicus TaxID=269420 RepID=A0ABN2MB86_9MICO
MRPVRRQQRGNAGREGERRAREGCAAESHVVVDDGCRGRSSVERRAMTGVRRGSPRELRCDRRPRGVGVAAGQFDAAQARAAPGFDERADREAAFVVDDGEVRHVAAQPWQVPTRRDHPWGGDHRENDAVAGVVVAGAVEVEVIEPHRGVAERGEVREQ